MNKKMAAGVFSLLLAANMFAGCSNKNNVEQMPVVTDAVEATATTVNMDDYFSVYAETEPDDVGNVEETTYKEHIFRTEHEAKETSTAVVSEQSIDVQEEDENAQEIRDMLEEMFLLNGSVSPDDYDAIYDYVDLDVLYYMAKGEKGDKETIINYLKEQGEKADVASLTMTGSAAANCKNTVTKVTPLSSEENEEYRKFLDIQSGEELSAYMAEKTGIDVSDENFDMNVMDVDVDKEDADKLISKYVPFSEMKEQFNITDVYCATVVVTPASESDFSVSENETNGIDLDMSMTFYVFKIDGKWKLDLPYSMENIIIEMLTDFGQMFGTDDYDIDFDSEFSDIIDDIIDDEYTDITSIKSTDDTEDTTRIIVN